MEIIIDIIDSVWMRTRIPQLRFYNVWQKNNSISSYKNGYRIAIKIIKIKRRKRSSLLWNLRQCQGNVW